MKLVRGRVLAAALSITAAAGGLLLAGTAHAQEVTTGTLSFSGDADDYISQGDSWSYSTSKGDALSGTGSKGGVRISLTGYNGDWWSLEFDAPSRATASQPAYLAPGTYTGAHRAGFNGTGPGLDLSGEGRGCNELVGSFTITKAVFGSGGYVRAFDATFEQHCEEGNAAARGKVHISNPAQPAASAPERTPASSPRAAASSARAAANSPRAATSSPAATPTGAPSATPAGIGNLAANDTGADASGVARSSVRASVLPVGVGVLDWVVLVAFCLVAVGLVTAVKAPQ